MNKFESKLIKARLISRTFVEIDDGHLCNKHRKQSIAIVIFELVSSVRFFTLFTTSKTSTLAYYLGDTLVEYKSLGKAIYLIYLCGILGAVGFRIRMLVCESTGRLKFLTDFTSLIETDGQSDKLKNLRLTSARFKKLRATIDLAYKSMMLWSTNNPIIAAFIPISLSLYSMATTDDRIYVTKTLIDTFGLIHMAVVATIVCIDIFFISHVWYISIHYLNLRLDQFNDSIECLNRLSILNSLVGEFYEIYFNRIKLYDEFSKWFIFLVNFLANPITSCFIYIVVMGRVPIPAVKIICLIIAANALIYSVFCTTQTATIHTKARKSLKSLFSYQSLMAVDMGSKRNFKLRGKVRLVLTRVI